MEDGTRSRKPRQFWSRETHPPYFILKLRKIGAPLKQNKKSPLKQCKCGAEPQLGAS